MKQYINFIYEDDNGLLWAATDMGKIYCFYQEQNKLIEFISDTKNPLILGGTEVTEIYEDKKGTNMVYYK